MPLISAFSFNPLQVQTNQIMPYRTFFKYLFQSPIGTNKTSCSDDVSVVNIVCFNPLQVQTKLKKVKKPVEKTVSCFNLLQVQTKLHTYLLFQPFVYQVSIPYRYKQNLKTSIRECLKEQCFNPLQVQTKQKHFIKYKHNYYLFQSPIGTNKTWIPMSYYVCMSLGFNPLQVQTKQKCLGN